MTDKLQPRSLTEFLNALHPKFAKAPTLNLGPVWKGILNNSIPPEELLREVRLEAMGHSEQKPIVKYILFILYALRGLGFVKTPGE